MHPRMDSWIALSPARLMLQMVSTLVGMGQVELLTARPPLIFSLLGIFHAKAGEETVKGDFNTSAGEIGKREGKLFSLTLFMKLTFSK